MNDIRYGSFSITPGELTPLEALCTIHAATGESDKEIGKNIHRSYRTVQKRLQYARDKLQTKNRTALVAECLKLGIMKVIVSGLMAFSLLNVLGVDDTTRPQGRPGRSSTSSTGRARTRDQLFWDDETNQLIVV